MSTNPSTALQSKSSRLSGFTVAVAILFVSAVVLNVAFGFFNLKFTKDAVPLTKSLASLPVNMGPWVQVSKDEPLDKEVADSLATSNYIFRDYVDSRLVSKATLAEFDGKGSTERKNLVGRLQMLQPTAVVNLAVTYYTGLVDTVAHIPERCYVADGFQPSTFETVAWDVGPLKVANGPALGAVDPKLEFRYINFEDQTGAGRITRRVAYCFFTNGHFESDPVGVRTTLQDLRAKHGFYSKIELMTIIPDHDRCESVMTDFLTSAMPEIQKCYPDWNSVEYGSVKK
jgi:hypothetical protein